MLHMLGHLPQHPFLSADSSIPQQDMFRNLGMYGSFHLFFFVLRTDKKPILSFYTSIMPLESSNHLPCIKNEIL